MDFNYIKSYIKKIGKPKVLFIWIPKNAGTSIYRSLNASCGMREYLTSEYAIQSFTNNGLATFGHMDINLLLDNKIIKKSFYRKSFKFCVCRNPYDRFVSLSHYMKKKKLIPYQYQPLDLMSDIIRKGIPEPGILNVDGISQCNRQVEWLKNIEIDKVLRFENINEEIKELEPILNTEIDLKYLNISSARKTVSMELDSKTIKLIKEYYEEDFLRFDYSFSI